MPANEQEVAARHKAPEDEEEGGQVPSVARMAIYLTIFVAAICEEPPSASPFLPPPLDFQGLPPPLHLPSQCPRGITLSARQDGCGKFCGGRWDGMNLPLEPPIHLAESTMRLSRWRGEP